MSRRSYSLVLAFSRPLMSSRPEFQLLPVRVVRALINLASSARYQVEGDSMMPALARRQHVLVGPLGFSSNRVRRGDIVVLRHPVSAKRVYIKRVIGLPDEEIRLEGGLVYVNGALLEEAYLDGQTLHGKEHDREWWIGAEEYFVMGDNRSDSQDSRAFGPVNRQGIFGRVWFRYWPLTAWGPIPGRPRKSP